MDDPTQALNEQVETETTFTESPAVEQTADTETTVSTQPSEVPKKGAQARIREVISENKSLKDRIAELTSPVAPVSPQIPYIPQEQSTNDDGTIDPQEFRRQVLSEAYQAIDLRSRQNAVIARINQETTEVVSKYKELDPESDSFDPEISDAIYDIVEAKVKADPTASVKDVVKKQMTLLRREASREEAKTDAVIAKQTAQSAIRPTPNKPVDTKHEESVEEMRARIGYAQ